MSNEAKRIKREEAFTLSMVDLFGCGFAGATFLFIFNMLQPQLDAIERAASAASDLGSVEAAASMADGEAGPVFVSIRSGQELALSSKSVPSLAGVAGVPNETNPASLAYDRVLPDSNGVRWPLDITFTGKSADPAQKFDVVVRSTIGNSTAVGHVLQVEGGRRVTISFDRRGTFAASTQDTFKNQLGIDLKPARKDNSSYHSSALFMSEQGFQAAAGWSGGVENITVTHNGTKTFMAKANRGIPDCLLFAASDTAVPTQVPVCPEDPTELRNAVAGEPWRSNFFARADGTGCTYPFSGDGCPEQAASPRIITQFGLDAWKEIKAVVRMHGGK